MWSVCVVVLLTVECLNVEQTCQVYPFPRYPFFLPLLPVYLVFNISTRFGNSQNLLFLPVNIGEIRETTIDFMKVNILF